MNLSKQHLVLPLSWGRGKFSGDRFHSVQLRSRKTRWVVTADIRPGESFAEAYRQLIHVGQKNLLFRGCDHSVKLALEKEGFKSVWVGEEAVLDLAGEHFKKKSLRELVRRGNRHGRCHEIKFTDQNNLKIEQLKIESAHGREPELKLLFRNNFQNGTRCFVFETDDGAWLAAVSLSQMHATKMQTELLLRRINAPVGVVEALLFFIFQRLAEENFEEWSLGEVPFMVNMKNLPKFSKSFLINSVGRALKYAYNYQSLYTFKNKFKPQWKPVFLCARPAISIGMLIEVFRLSQFLHLVLYRFARINLSRRKIPAQSR